MSSPAGWRSRWGYLITTPTGRASPRSLIVFLVPTSRSTKVSLLVALLKVGLLAITNLVKGLAARVSTPKSWLVPKEARLGEVGFEDLYLAGGEYPQFRQDTRIGIIRIRIVRIRG